MEKLSQDDSAPSSRREFLRRASVIAIALAGSSFLLNQEACNVPDQTVGPSSTTGQKVTLTLANEAGLKNVGGFIRRTFGGNNDGNDVIVMRLAASGTDAFKTMSVVCTHAGCAVNNPSGGIIQCPCHGSTFGAQAGNFAVNLGGPAPTPLQTFPTTFDGTTITISF